MLYSIGVVGAWLVCHALYRFCVIGRENLPQNEPGRPGNVIVCNHRSMMDVIFLAVARFRWPKAIVMSKAELFAINPVFSALFRSLGGFPISRGKGDLETVDKVVEAVKSGRDLIIFPEGTRSKTGEMGPLKSGAFLIAARAGAQVVPCRVLYQSGKPRLFAKVRMVIGKPLSAEQLGLAGEPEGVPSTAALRQARRLCAACMEELRAAYAHTVERTGK